MPALSARSGTALMLREIDGRRTDAQGRRQRWFHDPAMDLFVWYAADDSVAAFQLAYDKSRAERVVSWRAGEGLSHHVVDDGARPGRHPASPTLSTVRGFDRDEVTAEFEIRAAAMDAHVAAVVGACLRGDEAAEMRAPARAAGAPLAVTATLLALGAALAGLAWQIL